MIHAVIDIGSNTATLAVFRLDGSGIDRIAQEGEPLRLMRRLSPDGMFPPSAIERTAQAMRGFARRAADLGASAIDAVATSAVRDARNQDALLAAIQATGVPVRMIGGEEEAGLAVRAAVGTLPFTDGFVFDLGGGSLQLARVRRRRATHVMSLPLGGLRMADGFLPTDPPVAVELTRLRRHVEATLRAIPWLRTDADDVVVGMGGSVRAMAKVDRRERRWPIAHDHGYRLDEDAILATYESLSRMDLRGRASVPGLATHRADTIVPALVVVGALLRVLRSESVRISTAGVREGLALMQAGRLRSLTEIRSGALHRRLPSLTPAQLRRVAAATGDTIALAREMDRTMGTALLDAPLHGFWQEDVLHAITAAGYS